jgi:hypothetical protein
MSEPLWVTLTNRELTMAAECGIMRNIACLIDGREPAHGFDDENGSWNAHVEGACGEVAAAKVLGRFWSPTVNTFHAPDIGLKIQVRTRSRHDYDLLVRSSDGADHAVVCVTGLAPRFAVHGYLIAQDARRDEWVQRYGGRPPAWFVPKKHLRDIRDLLLGAAVA